MTINKQNYILTTLLLSALVIALLLTPDIKQYDENVKFKLEEIVPKQFGDWVLKSDDLEPIISPDVKLELDKIYNQTLTRKYTNKNGQAVMLSIAYGGNQSSEDMQVHRPEYCYSAQGFAVKKIKSNVITTNLGNVNVNRILAVLQARHEPITYWITIGNQATLPGIQRKLIQLRYGLSGVIPDGMLVRLSSISNDTEGSYRMHDLFFNDLLNAIDPNEKVRFIGKH